MFRWVRSFSFNIIITCFIRDYRNSKITKVLAITEVLIIAGAPSITGVLIIAGVPSITGVLTIAGVPAVTGFLITVGALAKQDFLLNRIFLYSRSILF